MKRLFIYTLTCLFATLMGCDKSDEVMNNLPEASDKQVTVTAHIQGDAATRVTLTPATDEDSHPIVKVEWKNDADNPETFTAYADGADEPILFTQTADTGDSKNLFEATLPETPAAQYTLYYGAKDYDLSTQDGTLNEAYVLMQATATDFSTTIEFEHKTAILKPTFKVGDAALATNTITQIVVEGIKNPTATTETGNITITPSELENIYLFLPAFESYAGPHDLTFTVTVGEKNYGATLTIPEGRSIEAGNFYTATIKLTEIIPYLTFTATEAQTFTITAKGGNGWNRFTLPKTLEYSVGAGEWIQLTADTEISFGGDKGTLRLRGKSSIGTAEDSDKFSQISFVNDSEVACTGDIRTLVDWKNYDTVETNNTRFCKLFQDCSSLTTAPVLPATTLASSCYRNMFYGCTSLETAPELPAETLKVSCYSHMFFGCTSLKTAPELPATTLASSCYKNMFYGCTSLETAPELLATTLAESCCEEMFSQCTSLETAPSILPAETLKESCYKLMFDCCYELTATPVLPATTLAKSCYNRMFRDCILLNSITMLATDISATGCLDYWVNSVATSGTFTKAATMTSLPTGVHGIPKNWTVVDYTAPTE